MKKSRTENDKSLRQTGKCPHCMVASCFGRLTPVQNVLTAHREKVSAHEGLRSLASPHSNCTSCAVLKLASTSSLWLYNQSSRAHKRLCGCRLALPLALLLLLLLLSLLACTPRLTLSPTRGRDRRKWRGPMTAAAHAKLATWWGASAELPGRPLIAKRS
eukprot:1159103-Pelagomonas_calceolata.AAC.5